jgi:hypothetical protein
MQCNCSIEDRMEKKIMPGYRCRSEQPKKTMTVLPPEIRVRRIFQHSQVRGRAAAAAGISHLSVHPSVPPSLCYDSPGRKVSAEIFIEYMRRELSWKHVKFYDAFNFGQSL